MKRAILSLTLLLTCSAFLSAQESAQAIFDEANTHFENGDFEEAMAGYKSIIKTGQVSGALYLNMGITAVQLDSMGLAKYYFITSTDFETTVGPASSALEYVNSQFSRQSAMLPKLPWDRAVQWINEVITAPGLFMIGFIITVSGLIFLYLGWLNKIPLKKSSNFIITSIITGTILAGLAFYADYVNNRYDEAVLITNSGRVLQSPNPESTLQSIAYEGYDLTVDHWKSTGQPGWLYIRLGNGQYGWIQNEGVKVL